MGSNPIVSATSLVASLNVATLSSDFPAYQGGRTFFDRITRQMDRNVLARDVRSEFSHHKVICGKWPSNFITQRLTYGRESTGRSDADTWTNLQAFYPFFRRPQQDWPINYGLDRRWQTALDQYQTP